ncbi:hypothetical protein GN244_ATG16247 [Phytophthora infestans]|uniref:HTH psq-type domain-containing protein n=1 Tax=Phytophthora infestans TaxID=4787 RepID=A0A833RS44_PHYIN|nr:hypothetical protein GN244_ATG16247 [Phytophthora infestans]
MDDPPPNKKKQRWSYTIRDKRVAARRMKEIGVEEVARELLCARGTAHVWYQQADKLVSLSSHATDEGPGM